jgi:hypothetical protein
MRLRRIAVLFLAAIVLGVPVAGAQGQHPSAQMCSRGYYKNVSGHCVHSPAASPVGATAKCRDSTYSYSEHASGTCSHHGGVALWIHHP